jgi:hypothetical protein
MTISTSDLLLTRTYPQQHDLRLSIFQPKTVLACLVNDGTIAKGERVIKYNTVTAGSYTQVESGMTMLVGTTAGGEQLGRIRVRSATATTITVAENSNISWADNRFLTVIGFFDIVPIFPRIVSNPADIENPIFYKDYDIAYTNQNKIMGTFVNMGSHREVELDEGGTGTIYYTSSGTYNVNGQALNYLWEFEGAVNVTGSTARVPGNVTYNTPGNYLTTLTTTSSSGAVDKSYRYIIVNRHDGGVIDWEMTGLQGSRSSSGYTANIKINSALSTPITPGSVIIISQKSTYGNTVKNIGHTRNQEDIFFVGYVLQDTIKYDYEKSSVEFQIGTVTELMKLSNGFAISVEDVDIVKTWYQIKGLNLRKAAYHFWRWHSTVLLTTDVEYIGTDWPQQFYDCNKESLYDAVNSVLKSARIGQLTSSRTSKLWMEIEVRATHGASTAFPSELTVNRDDWMGEPTIQEAVYDQTAYLEMGGIEYSGPGDQSKNSKPRLACAPGTAPSNNGKSSPITGLSVKSQAQLNNLVGDVFYTDNAQYPRINMDLRGAYTYLDIAPQTTNRIDIVAADTARNIRINSQYSIEGMSWSYDHENRLLLAKIEYAAFGEGVGSTIEVPPPPNGGGNIPLPPPPIVPYPIIPIPGGTPHTMYSNILYVLADGDLFYTPNILDDVPVWFSGSWGASNSLISGGVFGVGHFKQFDVNSYGQVLLVSDGHYPCITMGLFNESKEIVASADNFEPLLGPNLGSANPYDYGIQGIGCIPSEYDVWATVVGKGYNLYKSFWFLGDGNGLTQGMQVPGTPDNNDRPSGFDGYISYSADANGWMLTDIEGIFNTITLRTVDRDAASQILVKERIYGSSIQYRHVRAGTVNDAVVVFISGQYLTGNGQVFENSINLAGDNTIASADLDPSGQYLMAGSGNQYFWRSSNAALSWEQITGTNLATPFTAPKPVFVNLGSSNNWVVHYIDAAGNRRMYLTLDFGDTWTDKSTEFHAVASKLPRPVVTQMRYIP